MQPTSGPTNNSSYILTQKSLHSLISSLTLTASASAAPCSLRDFLRRIPLMAGTTLMQPVGTGEASTRGNPLHVLYTSLIRIILSIYILYSSAIYLANNLSCFVLLFFSDLLQYSRISDNPSGFHLNWCSGADSDFRFGFQFWVPRHSRRSEPALLASLVSWTI